MGRREDEGENGTEERGRGEWGRYLESHAQQKYRGKLSAEKSDH